MYCTDPKKEKQVSMIHPCNPPIVTPICTFYPFPKPGKIDVNYIVRVVSAYFGCTVYCVKSKNREETIKTARFFCMYFIYKLRKDYTLKMIGRMFNNRDHTTVINAIRKVNQYSHGPHKIWEQYNQELSNKFLL